MKKKRVLSGLLSLCLLLSLSPVAFAGDNEFTLNGLVYKITDATNSYVEVAKVSAVPQSGEITIPATVENDEISYTVVGIGSGAIGSSNAAVTGIQSVSMPMDSEYFTYIGSDAFQNCAEIESLTIPSSVEKIGFISKTASGDYDYTTGGLGVFYAMTSLKSVIFADGSNLKLLGTNAFHDCTALETLTLPSGIKDIGSTIVTGCTSLDSLTIPSSVQNLSPTVFVGYYANEDETPNCSVQEGGKYKLCDGILYDDTSLLNVYEYYEEVTVPEGITTIGDNAFSPYEGNSVLKSVTLPDSLTTLGEQAFIACCALEEVNFGNSSLSEIPDYAFAGCTSLKSISVPEGVTSIGEGAFFGCTSLESIILPEGLNTIGDYAFALCDEDFVNDTPSLNSINIPSSVTSLGVCFLAGVKENGETALIFQGNSLPTFEEDDGLSALSAISAENEMNSPTVYYPAGAADAYTNESSALLGAGLVTAPTSGGMNEQGYGLPTSGSHSIVANTTKEIGVYTKPSAAELSVTSSDTSKVTVSTENGKIAVTGVATDTTPITITAKITKGSVTLVEETYSITVTPYVVSVTNVELNKDSLSLREGKTTTLTATVQPEDATNKKVTWTSSNPDVATVENGVVTAVSKGEATITVTTEDGSKTAACTVTVTKKSSSSSSSSSSYSVSAPSKVENGTVKVSPSKAEKGDTVTITVTPDEGYVVDEVIVTDKNGKEISVKDKGNGKFTFTMPASKVDIEVSFAEIDTTCDGGKDCASYRFDDVNVNDWYHEAVDYMVERGLMNGTSATTFEPNTTTTRAMLVSVLYRLENTPVVVGASNFNDVPAGQYYTDAVAWANANGIVTGYGNGNFGPNDTLTREQMAAIIYRYAAYKGYDVSARANLSGYTDAAQISGYAADAMAWINAEEIISGTSATTLSPAGNATRCQFAVILMRFCENVAK